MAAITIPKKKIYEPTVSVSAPNLSTIAAEIDAFGRLSKEAAPLFAQIEALQKDPKIAAVLKARKALEAAVDALPLDDDCEEAIERGLVYQAEIGKRGKSRSISDLIKVREMMGEDLFMTLAKVNLGDMDKYLTPPQLDQVISISRTAHSFKVTERV